MKISMVVFDADGTLLNNKLGGFVEILFLLGKEKEAQAIFDEYQERKGAGPWGLEQLTELYRGFFEEELFKIAKRYCWENLMPGAQDLMAEIRKKNTISGVISSNPQFLLYALRSCLMLDFACGTCLEFQNGKATGKMTRRVDRNVKAEILQAKMQELGLAKEEVIVVGDSLTDIPMAENAGQFFAFNADEQTKKRANIVINKKDLREVIKYL